MAIKELDYHALTKTLVDNFNILADDVQLLSDRKTILEHKLRFAHEQYQYLADKYATADSEISKTLAKLQLPPDLDPVSDRGDTVPLPSGQRASSKQQTAVAIRDGRSAAQSLESLACKPSRSIKSGRSFSGSSSNMRLSARRTSLSTVLEQDFTVPGKKSSLLCPYAVQTKGANFTMRDSSSQDASVSESNPRLTPSDAKDPTPHQSSDPICAAMYAETMSSAPPSMTGSAAKCPIRYLDQHSPEEVAKYFETHKHEIPRSHEVCVKRYQRNEDDIRKLDAKYGNLVSMIQGLGQKHQPMLPAGDEEEALAAEHDSNERVENWAKSIHGDGAEGEEILHSDEEDDRESRFDRQLKEIRVGESPSRPWGIRVPILDQPLEQRPADPLPVPVSTEHPSKPAGKCPFGFGPQTEDEEVPPPAQPSPAPRPTGKCPFPHGQTPAKDTTSTHHADVKSKPSYYQSEPAFIQPPEAPKVGGGGGGPQMVFTGPVFIGYPIEHAMALMQQWKNT